MKKIFGFLIVFLALLPISTAFANEEQSSVEPNSEITTTSSNSPCTETSDDTDGEWVPLPITMYIPDGKGGTYPTIIYQPTYIRHQKKHDNNSESNCTQKEQSHTGSVTIPILIVVLLVFIVIYSVM
jgi:hypothetical protein